MSDPITDTPTAPPASPTIPVGLGTQIGLGATAAAVVGGFIAIFLGGDHTVETMTAFGFALVTLVTVLAGRFAQAVAVYRHAPSPLQGVVGSIGSFLPTDEEIEEFERLRLESPPGAVRDDTPADVAQPDPTA